MTDHPTKTKDSAAESPAPEVLRPRASTENSAPPIATPPSSARKPGMKLHHLAYRPSHKATFIGLAVVAAILAINVGVISFVMNSQAKDNSSASGEVTINSATLDKLGVSRNPIGNAGTELVVGPDSKFNGKVTVAGNVSIAGELQLSSKFAAADASLTKLQAGETSLEKLTVNSDITTTNLNVRKDLVVEGATRLQGPATFNQLLTVNNSMNVAGNLAVGGVLSARSFQASSLVSDTTLTIGGHIITRGSAPGVGPGGGVGNNGTVSISGNDASGTVAVNVGTSGGNGILANIAFRQQYGSTPHVVVTAVGAGAGSVYVTRTVGGFSIGVSNSLSPGGYAFDYIVMQ